MESRHTRDPWIGLRKLVGLTLNIQQIFNKGLFFLPFFIYMFGPKANMNILLLPTT